MHNEVVRLLATTAYFAKIVAENDYKYSESMQVVVVMQSDKTYTNHSYIEEQK